MNKSQNIHKMSQTSPSAESTSGHPSPYVSTTHIFTKVWFNMQHLAELPRSDDGGSTTKQYFIAPYFELSS